MNRKRTKNFSEAVGRVFAKNLARHRLVAGLTQEELSRRADLHRTEISQLERALRVPRIDTVIRLADSLGVNPQLLIAGITWKPAPEPLGAYEFSHDADVAE